jgi:cytochrome P450
MGLHAVARRRDERKTAAANIEAAPNLLDLLLDARDSGSEKGTSVSELTLSDPELLDNAITFLLAGRSDKGVDQ